MNKDLKKEIDRLTKIELNIKNRIAIIESRLSKIIDSQSYNHSDKVQTVSVLRETVEELKEDIK